MTMYERACEEVRIACTAETGDDVDEYMQDCYKSALKAMKSLCEDRHSGMSICFTRNILMRMIEGKPLTPIEDIPEAWDTGRDDHHDGIITMQCKRMPSLFKRIDKKTGKTWYTDVDRDYCVTEANPDIAFTNGRSTKIVDELFPITMPYYPSIYKKKIVAEEFLSDEQNGDYDTFGYLWLEDPDTCSKRPLRRYFKEVHGKKDFVQISQSEYLTRVQRHYFREALTFLNSTPTGAMELEAEEHLYSDPFDAINHALRKMGAEEAGISYVYRIDQYREDLNRRIATIFKP